MDMLSPRYRGVVREFNRVRGCGTIEIETGEQVFVRYSAIVGQGLRTLRSGDQVSCNVELAQRGLIAVRVTRD